MIIAFIVVVAIIYIMQLFSLQVIKQDYKASADNNAFLYQTIHPARGTIYDRNGELLVFNQPAYDLMVVFKETQPFDTTEFCRILKIDPDYFKKRQQDIKNRGLNPGYSSYTPQVFLTQLGFEEYGLFQENSYKFPGFYTQRRTIREYKRPNAAHILGYIAEVDKKDIAEDDYYVRGDYIGKSGIENFHEKYLRGEKGIEILLRDSKGRIKGKYNNGDNDRESVPGKNLKLSIDIELQAYGEELMQNKLGSIIMIEPSTGEILCMVSSPTYDPAILVGREFGNGYISLANNPYKPLFNRALTGTYPPGSTFKTTQGLIFLEEGIIQPSTIYSCWGKSAKPNCHDAAGRTFTLVPAVATSCNAFFSKGLISMLENRKKYKSFQEAMNKWRDHMVGQGFGYKLGIDLPGESRGMIPNSEYYDKNYNSRWNAYTVISIAIGQGEVTATPLQIGNLAASIANRGFFYTPHVVKEIADTPLDTLYTEKRGTSIAPEHYIPIVEGMRAAVLGGTCRGANIPDVVVCGKTGTAQNKGKDHSIFMGFAPMEEPKVSIYVYVENGGFGATYAVPISRLMIQKYLKREIPAADKDLENRMKNAVILRNVP
ncbi:MAG: penicillin-binding protein 2 [Dysgonamonadaceae bacterium]|jgi:penicillin-binding protein 2|nr:penicillin-binding protein 2 [Dysgonamonadaceae bacterium]